MSGDEFRAKWDAGEIDTTNPETYGAIMNIVGLIEFARENNFRRQRIPDAAAGAVVMHDQERA